MITIRMFLVLVAFLVLQHDSDKILWDSNVKLKWADFKGAPPENTGFVKATTVCQIMIKSAARYEGETPNYDVKNIFIKNDSWTLTSNEKTLVHEQLHFDISELHARKIRKAFEKLYQEGITDTSTYRKVYKKLDEECYDMQKEYDREAHFNNKKQKEWEKCIAKELEDLKKYNYVPKE